MSAERVTIKEDGNGDLHTLYRPTTLEEVKGHTNVVASVKKVLAKRLGRAFLFVGPPGTGKTTLGRIVAKMVGCRRTNLQEVNAADHSGADDMRAIIDNLAFSTLGGGAKVVIIDEAQRLSPAAWSVLLKPVEEPPRHVYWVFCSTDPGKIPAAIQTRCQRYALAKVPDDDVRDLLEEVAKSEGWKVKPEILGLVVKKSDGSPRSALTYLAQVHDCDDRKEAADIIKSVSTEDGEVVDLCRALYKGNPSWEEIQRLCKPLMEQKPEGLRIVISHWFTKVAMTDTRPRYVERALEVLSAFSDPYPDAPNLSPLLLSLARLTME